MRFSVFIRTVSLICSLCVTLLFAACSPDGDTPSIVQPGTGGAGENGNEQVATQLKNTGEMDFSLSDRDVDASYDAEKAVKVVFSESSVKITGTGASANGTEAVLSAEGTYIVSGNCSNGSLRVKATAETKLQIVLDGLELSCSDGSPFIVEQADKVFVTLAEGSNNVLSDAGSYTQTVDASTVDAAMFSKDDMTLNGTGSLLVKGNFKHGIVSKDDLVIAGGKVTVSAASTGIDGKDCVKISGGTLKVTAGTNGIRASNAEDASRGFVSVSGGSITVTAGTDGIEAETVINIASGNVKLTTGGGSANSSMNDGWGQWGGFGGSSVTSLETSAKGLKAGSGIAIDGGAVTVDSSDDSVHSNGDVVINDGTLELTSGDDGVHADSVLTVNGGKITVKKSYEGLEASEIDIAGGTAYVIASDDGLNAAGGNDGSALGGRPGGNPFDADSSKVINISGGYLVVNASGDGIDSNGNVNITGGVTLVSGPTNGGNGSFDYGGNAVITGGVFIAAGSNGMAQSFSESSTQGSIMINLTSAQQAETPIILCDGSKNVLASFTPMKQYVNVVMSAPGIVQDKTFLLGTGKVSEADVYGFADSGKASPFTELAEIKMTSLHYSEGSGGMGGGGGFGGRPGGPRF